MPAISRNTRSPLRELASRMNSDVEVTLFWNECTGTVTVSLWDWSTDEHLHFAAAPDQALHAFCHPYAYAASVDGVTSADGVTC